MHIEANATKRVQYFDYLCILRRQASGKRHQAKDFYNFLLLRAFSLKPAA